MRRARPSNKVLRARILRDLETADLPLTVRELARRLGCGSHSHVHEELARMAEDGVVEHVVGWRIDPSVRDQQEHLDKLTRSSQELPGGYR